MSRYWSDSYEETNTVGQAADYNVTVVDAERWNSKQDKMYFDDTPTKGSHNLVDSGVIADEIEKTKQYAQEEGGKPFYVDVLMDVVAGCYGYHKTNFKAVTEAFKKGRTLVLRVIDTGEYSYLHSAGANYFKFVCSSGNTNTVFNMYWLYDSGDILTGTLTLPNIHAWALQCNKPSYTYSEVGAERAGVAKLLLDDHNINKGAHADIRAIVTALSGKVDAMTGVDENTLKQLEELMAYMDGNKDVIESITTGKVSVTDIVDDLVTSVSNKPLSAAQGVALRRMIEQITFGGTNFSTHNLELTGSLSMGRRNGASIGSESTALGKNVAALTEQSVATGIDTYAGCKGFYISAITTQFTSSVFDEEGNHIDTIVINEDCMDVYLSRTQVTDAPPLNMVCNTDSIYHYIIDSGNPVNLYALEDATLDAFSLGYNIGDKVTIVFPDDHHVCCGTIRDFGDDAGLSNVLRLENCTITADDLLALNMLRAHMVNQGIEWTTFADIIKPDDYTIVVPTAPHIGVVDVSCAAHAEGENNKASGGFSHAEGRGCVVAGHQGHAEGRATVAGYSAHSEGYKTKALGKCSHAEGNATEASGNNSHAEGRKTYATGIESHAEGGEGTTASGARSHAEGYKTNATFHSAHSEGNQTEASEQAAHAEGYSTKASGRASHSEGGYGEAKGKYAHVEGSHVKNDEETKLPSKAITYYFPDPTKGTAEYLLSKNSAEGVNSHVEGSLNAALGYGAHAEGYRNLATGEGAHVEGYDCVASGNYAHAEGRETVAAHHTSHAEGYNCQALKSNTHVEGWGCVADGNRQHVQGQWNEIVGNNYAHVIGGGSSATNRKNIHTVDWSGNAWYAGNIEAKGYFILASPNGTRFKLTVSDDGVLSATKL